VNSIEQRGDDLQLWLLASGLGNMLFYEEGSEGRVQFFKSFALYQLITEGLKAVTDKRRPNGNVASPFAKV
jgi:hypothetical protein